MSEVNAENRLQEAPEPPGVTTGDRIQEATPLPMCDPIQEKEFFVRSCYIDYYNEIMNCFEKENRRYITVTGTPGIGKSVFYLYFFKRFREENPEQVIVTAAFTKRSKLKYALVFDPKKEDGKPDYYDDKIPFISNAIFFYDGAPEKEPSLQKMVCFSSPNEEWLDSMDKNEYFTALYMPPWTLEELQEARKLLAEDPTADATSRPNPEGISVNMMLRLTEEEVERRFKIFGGSARYCLTRSALLYERGLKRLRYELYSIKSFSDLELNMKGCGKIPYNVLFMHPTGFKDYVIDFASVYVKERIEKNFA
jgi:hypothetical protein